MLRTAFVGRGGVIDPGEVSAELGHEGPSPTLPDWVLAWTEAEATRPWPPISVLTIDRAV